MFCNGFNESSQSTIALSDISYAVFVALVRFLYTDHIPPPSVDALVLPLLQQVCSRVFCVSFCARILPSLSAVPAVPSQVVVDVAVGADVPRCVHLSLSLFVFEGVFLCFCVALRGVCDRVLRVSVA
jgi:hypothetical protein